MTLLGFLLWRVWAFFTPERPKPAPKPQAPSKGSQANQPQQAPQDANRAGGTRWFNGLAGWRRSAVLYGAR